MLQSMSSDEISKMAERKAIEEVKTLLHNPDQLTRVSHFLADINKKKTKVDSYLPCACMSSQDTRQTQHTHMPLHHHHSRKHPDIHHSRRNLDMILESTCWLIYLYFCILAFSYCYLFSPLSVLRLSSLFSYVVFT